MSIPTNGRYGQWAGNERGYAARPGFCLEEVPRDWIFGQCSRKAKRGGLCEQHAREYEKRGKPLPISEDGPKSA